MLARQLYSVLLVLALAAAACGPRRLATAPAAPLRACAGTGVTWHWAPDAAHVLDLWCSSVGVPIVRSDVQPSRVTRLVIVTWNVHVGGGRLREVIDLVRARTPAPADGTTGFIFLLQEAFRGGSDVPDAIPHGITPPEAIRPVRPAPDIVDVANDAGLAIAYVPSMRNGSATNVYEREDRGAAILSSLPLRDVTAIELPFGRQRRVAVMATVGPLGAGQMLRVASAHLDVLRGTRDQARRLADHVRSLPSSVPTVLGIDTNALLGGRDSAVRTLSQALPRVVSCGTGRTNVWPGRIDFFFCNLPPDAAPCVTLADRFGSDHVPLVLTVDLSR